jgi:hypothetical protein
VLATRALLQIRMLASAAGVAAYKTAGYYDSMHPERPFLMYVALFEYMYIGTWSRATWIQL